MTVPVERVSPAHQYCKGRYIYELNQLTTVTETDDSNQDEIRETITTECSIKPNQTRHSNRRKTVPCLKLTPEAMYVIKEAPQVVDSESEDSSSYVETSFIGSGSTELDEVNIRALLAD